MSQRDTVLVLAGVLFGAFISLLFLSSALVAPPVEQRPEPLEERTPPPGRPAFVIGRSPLPTRRPVAELERQLPPEFRFVVSLVPLQRGLSDAAREAASYFLVLVLTAGTLALGRQHVVRAHAVSAGGLLEQARVFGLGVGVVLTIASTVVLGWILALAALAGRPLPQFRIGLELVFAAFALLALILIVAALIGFAAASWRLGVLVLGVPVWRRWGERVAAPLATLLGATVLYLLAQIPLFGILVAAVVIAYSLGAFVLARLAPPATYPTSAASRPDASGDSPSRSATSES